MDPVAKSKNNHPENLLWLCANHHVAYDGGLFGPDAENKEFVVGFKVALHRHKRMLWNKQDEASRKLFHCLDECDRLAEQLKGARTSTQVKAVETIARQTLAMIPDLGPVPRKDSHYKAYRSIAPSLSSFASREKNTTTISSELKEVQGIRKRYAAALGFVACPLCDAKGSYHGSDCPLCSGDREIPEKLAEQVDLSQYKYVKCPLCKGRGIFESDDCPECGGDGEMPTRYARQLDLSEYEKVRCPLCKGEGRFGGNDCPECSGDGEMPSRYAEQVDLSQYENVRCPLCKGKGTFDGNDCPECSGDGEMPSRYAEQVDVSKYERVNCPLCAGKGWFRGDDCPFCDGEKKVPRHAFDNFDSSNYS